MSVLYIPLPPNGNFRNPDYIREVRKLLGSPIGDWDQEKYLKRFQNMCSMSSIDGLGKCNVLGNPASYSKMTDPFFPNRYGVRIRDAPTLDEVFNDDSALAHALERSYKARPSLAAGDVRSKLTNTYNAQVARHFNPVAARHLYNYEAEVPEGKQRQARILDMSMGWGDRMVGFLASDAGEYFGVDVNSENFKSGTGYQGVYDLFSKYADSSKKVVPMQIGAEYFGPNVGIDSLPINTLTGEKIDPKKYRNYFDLSFTSPPYFGTEQYSEDEAQSYIKYNSPLKWYNNFYRESIKNQFDLLRNGGKMVINIQDTPLWGKSASVVNSHRDSLIELKRQIDTGEIYKEFGDNPLAREFGSMLSKQLEREDFQRVPLVLMTKLASAQSGFSYDREMGYTTPRTGSGKQMGDEAVMIFRKPETEFVHNSRSKVSDPSLIEKYSGFIGERTIEHPTRGNLKLQTRLSKTGNSYRVELYYPGYTRGPVASMYVMDIHKDSSGNVVGHLGRLYTVEDITDPKTKEVVDSFRKQGFGKTVFSEVINTFGAQMDLELDPGPNRTKSLDSLPKGSPEYDIELARLKEDLVRVYSRFGFERTSTDNYKMFRKRG